MFQVHGIKHEVRRHVKGKFCECCLQWFHTRERVLTHVMQSSERCRAFYLAFTDHMGEEEYLGVEATSLDDVRFLMNTGHRRSYAPFPPVRLSGPYREEACRLGVSWSHCLKCRPGTVRQRGGAAEIAAPRAVFPPARAVHGLDDPEGFDEIG